MGNPSGEHVNSNVIVGQCRGAGKDKEGGGVLDDKYRCDKLLGYVLPKAYRP